MVRQQRASKVHEAQSHGTSEHQGKDELVKHDMLDPPRYLRRTHDSRAKALSFGVLDWKQLEKWKDTNVEGTKGASCSYASSYNGSVETAAASLELDLSTGVVKRLEVDLKPQATVVNFSTHKRNESFSLRSQECSDAKDAADILMTMEEKRKHKEHSNVSAPLNVSRQKNPGSETSSKILSEAFRTAECQDRRHDLEGECSSQVERNQNIPTVSSKKGRDASPNRRFSFSFSQMSRSFSSKESSSSLSSTSHASAKSGPLTFTRTKPHGHNRTRSGPILIPKTENKNVPSLQVASKPSNTRPPPTPMEKKQSSSRVHALLQFTLRKGINLFQFVVGDNSNNVLAATMKSANSSTRSYTLYTVNEVKNKSGNWLGRHKNEHPFVHTIIGQMKTVTSFTSDSSIHKSESVLFGVDSTNEELAAIVQTRNMSQRHSTTTIIIPSGAHTLPKDCNNAPLPLIERWKSGGACDCGGWDIGCKLCVLSNDQTKSHTFSSFQLFDQERDEPAFKMVNHDDELHSVEFGSSISHLEAFFISLVVSSYQNWCEEAVLNRDGLLKREKSVKYASNPPVSPIGRV
ncbi:hypothetical protein V5N11_020588 [Cardamine amara subsp. amara]|uniref:Uncharacterized protein n=1 Tax=Cardamine amara subsp. amara TaxID=228776 RepID=A0ABD1ATE7_CARAN